MILSSEIRFVDENLKAAFYGLRKGGAEEKNLFKIIDQALNNIEVNAFCGIQLPKRLIAKKYSKKGIKNLWKYDLPRSWRLIYSVAREELIVVSIILEWFDHKGYERRFNY
jgi:Txe/YoeB family toxin of Txe-Axe toxin-antitoxin module